MSSSARSCLQKKTAAAHLDIDICIAFQQHLRVKKTTQHVMQSPAKYAKKILVCGILNEYIMM